MENEHNNYIKYESDIVSYGAQKFYNTSLSTENGLLCYYTIISAQM